MLQPCMHFNFCNLPLQHISVTGHILHLMNVLKHHSSTMVVDPYTLLFHNPLIFPATLSTVFFSRWDSFTTRSLSSSAHSVMNVVVSATKPANKMSSAMAV